VDRDELLCRSCHRVRSLLATHAPAVLIDKECRLLVRRIASRVGPDLVRLWADQFSDDLVQKVVTPADGGGES
jgi:hypothetical protein